MHVTFDFNGRLILWQLWNWGLHFGVVQPAVDSQGFFKSEASNRRGWVVRGGHWQWRCQWHCCSGGGWVCGGGGGGNTRCGKDRGTK